MLPEMFLLILKSDSERQECVVVVFTMSAIRALITNLIALMSAISSLL